MHGLRNHFLVAMPQLEDDNFSDSVVYVCDDDEKGVLGVILNRPLELTIGNLLGQLDIEVGHNALLTTPVLYGGPVHSDRGFILHLGRSSDWDSSLQVSDDIALTTSMDILRAIARGEGPEKYLVILGCAGWQVQQLTDELKSNSWLTVEATNQVVFDTVSRERRGAAAALLGIDLNLLGGVMGHG